MASRTMKFWKCSIYFYFIFFAVLGLFLGSVTSFVLIQTVGMGDFYNPIQACIYYLYAPTILIIIVTLISWRAIRKKCCILLKCISGLQIAIIIIEIIGVVWILMSMQMIYENALPVFQEKFIELKEHRSSNAWDMMQRKLKCCGIHGAFDYKTLNIVPFSCCNQAITQNFSSFCVSVYHEGCLDVFQTNLSENFSILATVSAAVAILQIPGVFATWYFAKRAKDEAMLRRNMQVSEKLLAMKGKQTEQKGTFTDRAAI